VFMIKTFRLHNWWRIRLPQRLSANQAGFSSSQSVVHTTLQSIYQYLHMHIKTVSAPSMRSSNIILPIEMFNMQHLCRFCINHQPIPLTTKSATGLDPELIHLPSSQTKIYIRTILLNGCFPGVQQNYIPNLA
jgi:hypothetical protein